MKICTKCEIEKELSLFNVDNSKKDKLHSICKDCHSIRNKNKRKSNPIWRKEQLEKSRLFRQTHPEKFKASVRNATIKKKYGIDSVEFQRLLEEQGGMCSICSSTTPRIDWGKNLHIDHDHNTGKVRGLLCQACNTSLGKFNHDVKILQRAIQYLERSN